MSEVEFDELLDVVRTAVAAPPGGDSMVAGLRMFVAAQHAANDNARVWPLIPFPDGWNAVC